MSSSVESSIRDFVSGRHSEFAIMDRKRVAVLKAKSTRHKVLFVCILAAVAITLIGVLSMKSILPVFFGMIFGVVIFFVISNKYKNPFDYTQEFTRDITNPLIHTFHPQFSMERRGLFESDYRDSKLYSRGYDRFSSKSMGSGKIGDTALRFSYIHTERKEVTRDSEGRRQTRWVTVFKGVLLIADFHKMISSEIEIVPDFAERSFGVFGRKLQSFGGGLVHLENPEFERNFKVSCRDSVAAHYAFTPDMQERFLRFGKRFKKLPRSRIVGSSLYMGFSGEVCNIEPSLNASPANIHQLLSIFHEVEKFASVVKDLDLNTRIWSKE